MSQVTQIAVIVSPILLVMYSIGVIIYLYVRVSPIEKAILKKKEEIDNIESDQESKRMLSTGMMNARQFSQTTAARKNSMEKELETLKLKRVFYMEKIPLLSILKK